MAVIPSPAVLSTDEMGRIAPPIMASVGRNGTNAPGDVFVIQSLLNERLPKPHSPVPVTGIADVGTTLAIQAYQAVVLNMTPPTGLVEPNSPTYYALAARPTVTTATAAGHFGEVPAEIIDAAIVSQKRWNVPASVTIAQWVVESAWGASMPPGSNNPFGIKAAGGQPFVAAPTQEIVGGEPITVTAKFRAFASLGEAFDEHGRLLATNAAYTSAMRNAADPAAFADALNGTYATDPNYGFTLKWVIQNYGFTRYDR
ncbi:MAG TPA: glucosaminidase domain-containing protein [Rhodopila sp.]|nr:glucosaminidase domain-containing protein [Rhodopila sp.]